jgi:hypothetical protein
LTSLEDSTVEPELREVSKKACGVTVWLMRWFREIDWSRGNTQLAPGTHALSNPAPPVAPPAPSWLLRRRPQFLNFLQHRSNILRCRSGADGASGRCGLGWSGGDEQAGPRRWSIVGSASGWASEMLVCS